MKIRLHVTQIVTTKQANQTQRGPFAEQKKTPMVYQERNNTYNLLDESEIGWEKIVTICKNKKENREKLGQQKSTEGKNIGELTEQKKIKNRKKSRRKH